MKRSDWENVSAIYAQGIATGMVTFQQTVPSYETWHKAHLQKCRLVVEQGHRLLGWAALSPVSKREVYQGVAEVSIYVETESRGHGVGQLLLQGLVSSSEKAGFWTLQSAIFPENTGSIKLHEKMGFRKVGLRERIGQLDGSWKDNLLFERRSGTTGR
jgi:phosphinothricin acetyltransferase